MRHDWFWIAVAFAAGFGVAVLVGARSGEQMAAGVAEILETCDAISRMDRAECSAGLDMHAAALRALGDRCVLSVPIQDNLRVARVPPKGMGR